MIYDIDCKKGHEPTADKYFNAPKINMYITVQDISQSVLSYEKTGNAVATVELLPYK